MRPCGRLCRGGTLEVYSASVQQCRGLQITHLQARPYGRQDMTMVMQMTYRYQIAAHQSTRLLRRCNVGKARTDRTS